VTALRLASTLLTLALVACQSTARARDGALPTSNVTVVRADGKSLRVAVELAHDDPTRTKGMMFRERLEDGDGMLFVFDDARALTFWMKNTLIPLDMLFATADGRIAGIVERARPHDTSPRGPDTPTRYVLEVPGGWCLKNGVKTGDRLELTEALAALDTFRASSRKPK